ncbi:hypothetical protein PAMP_007446 [Pampus punctatissimus]
MNCCVIPTEIINLDLYRSLQCLASLCLLLGIEKVTALDIKYQPRTILSGAGKTAPAIIKVHLSALVELNLTANEALLHQHALRWYSYQSNDKHTLLARERQPTKLVRADSLLPAACLHPLNSVQLLLSRLSVMECTPVSPCGRKYKLQALEAHE